MLEVATLDNGLMIPRGVTNRLSSDVSLQNL